MAIQPFASTKCNCAVCGNLLDYQLYQDRVKSEIKVDVKPCITCLAAEKLRGYSEGVDTERAATAERL